GRIRKLCLLVHVTSYKAVYTVSVPLPSVNNCAYSLNGMTSSASFNRNEIDLHGDFRKLKR
ncbi:hypothetical protein L9F63_026761, partial [Diploptera punctata]